MDTFGFALLVASVEIFSLTGTVELIKAISPGAVISALIAYITASEMVKLSAIQSNTAKAKMDLEVEMMLFDRAHPNIKDLHPAHQRQLWLDWRRKFKHVQQLHKKTTNSE